MNRVKLVLLVAISIALTFTFFGCAVPIQHASLSKGMPETFFEDKKIEADVSKSVSYTFDSKLADPFVLYDYRIDLNPSYKSILNNYMNHKYTTVDNEDGGYNIDVILEDCTAKVEPAGKQTAEDGAGHSASVYVMKITTEMVVKVRVNVNGKISEKNITSIGEYTGSTEEHSTVTRSFDLAIRATISQIDKFLNSALN
jgi:hypothetical protein